MGAEIISTKKGEQELIWQSDTNVWKGHAPLLFPTCGGLKKDKFVYNGKSYTMPKHGFARTSEFEAETVTENSATFLLKLNSETKNAIPLILN